MTDGLKSQLADPSVLNDATHASFLARYDIDQTHQRRVRLIVYAVSALLVLLGILFFAYFTVQSAYFVAAQNMWFTALGLGVYALARTGRVQAATYCLFISLIVSLSVCAAVFDRPIAGAARSIHYYFLPLALGAYFVFRVVNRWLRHGLPLACLILFVVFASSNLGFPTAYALPPDSRPPVWIVACIAVSALFLLLHIFMGDINRMENFLHDANNRFVELVKRLFPPVIAEKLLATGKAFSQRHANCSILIADIVGFTSLSERMEPQALVQKLGDIFLRFDRCVERMGLTKIKTIGDAYMVASGVPEPDADHATKLLEFGVQMFEQIKDMEGINLRIGIASGELVAGVIGQSRQIYDVWGDVVNMASRMESQGLTGRIQVSEATFLLAKNRFDFDLRDVSDIGPKGDRINLYLLRRA